MQQSTQASISLALRGNLFFKIFSLAFVESTDVQLVSRDDCTCICLSAVEGNTADKSA